MATSTSPTTPTRISGNQPAWTTLSSTWSHVMGEMYRVALDGVARRESGIRYSDPGEEVVLRDDGPYDAEDQLVVLGRPAHLLDLARHREPMTVGVDLGRMRAQRVVAYREEVGAGDERREPVRPLVVGERREPLGVDRLQAVLVHELVEPHEPVPVAAHVVVDLLHLPHRPRLWHRLWIRRHRDGRHRDLVAHDVVGVRVAALLVVRQQHLRA